MGRLVIELETLVRPGHRHQTTRSRQREIRRFEVGPTKTDVGGEWVAREDLLEHFASRRNNRDTSRLQPTCCDAHVAVTIHCQRVEQLQTWQTTQQIGWVDW